MQKTKSPGDQLGGVLDFMSCIWGLDHALNKRSKRMRREQGITGPQRLVLRIVSRFPGICAGALADALHLHRSTLSGILDRLEQRELLAREPDPMDGRRAFFRLTRKGRTLQSRSVGTVEETVALVLANTSKHDRVVVENLLRKLTYALDQAPE